MDISKPYYVYVIKSEHGRRYIGLSENTEERIKKHNKGLSVWTSRYKGWRLVYKKKFDNLTEAKKWENYLKRQKGGNIFKEIIDNYNKKNNGP